MIVVCGEALIDLTPTDHNGTEAFVPRPGGSPFNIAIGVARLGAPASFLGRFGDDFFGAQLRDRLTADGVDLTYAVTGPELTTLAFVHLVDGVEPEFAFYAERSADRLLAPGDLPAVFSDDVEALHFGSISLVLEPGATTLEGLLQREHGKRVITMDPNVRPGLIPDPDAYRTRLEGLVALTDVVKVSRADLDWLYPGEPVTSVARRWLAMGPSLLVVTLGPDGVLGLTGSGTVQLAGIDVKVADTVGAGDAFMSGLLAGLHERGALKRGLVGTLGEPELAEILGAANRGAALTCMRHGADPPNRAELEAALVR
jgi:fructokinase